MSSRSSSSRLNSVFYADMYHPIQAGSIDGTDILPHDNAVYRALLCSSAGLYDPLGDPNVIGDDPYCTIFVGRLSPFTTEESLRKAMSKYGTVKKLRLVRHVVTGASRGYAFVEYETEREMRRAYENAHHSIIDDSEIIVDYNRQQLMPGWIPRRLGGGLGGKKESGQLRFGGRERPFRAPLRPIPFDDLKRLGIPPPPEGKYMSRFDILLPPRRNGYADTEDSSEKSHKRSSRSQGRERRSTSRHPDDERGSMYTEKHGRSSRGHERRSRSPDHRYEETGSMDYEKHSRTSRSHERRSTGRDHQPDERSSFDREDDAKKSRKHSRGSDRRERRSDSHDYWCDERRYADTDQQPHKRHKHN